MTFSHISILGLGLIGGSIALACRDRASGLTVKGYDTSGSAIDAARASGAVNELTTDLRVACEGADCVILCVPLAHLDGLLRAIGPLLQTGTVVTDVSSTKQSIQNLATTLLPAGVHFVGSHPMAGREQSGFAAARADLFEGATCLTTPVLSTDADALAKVESLWQTLGSTIVRLSPEQHDRAVAQISHLPHLLASALVNCVSDEALALCGPGFRDATRIAAGNPELWRQILLDNATDIHTSVRQFREELDKFEAMLRAAQTHEVQNWLATAAARRGRLMMTKSRKA